MLFFFPDKKNQKIKAVQPFAKRLLCAENKRTRRYLGCLWLVGDFIVLLLYLFA